jgi:hypothetical protein
MSVLADDVAAHDWSVAGAGICGLFEAIAGAPVDAQEAPDEWSFVACGRLLVHRWPSRPSGRYRIGQTIVALCGSVHRLTHVNPRQLRVSG